MPLSQDVRFALRSLFKTPMMTGLALLALAIGIGANTAIFSVIKAVLIDPLPFAEPDQIVSLVDSNPQAGMPRFSSSFPNFVDWRKESRSFQQLAAVSQTSFNLTGEKSGAELLNGARVSAELFDLLGVRPALGSGFSAEQDRPGAEPVVVLGHGLWRRELGGDPQAVGRTVQLNGESYRVVGVMPESFSFPRGVELWAPLAMAVAPDDRGDHRLQVYGRLKPGVALASAQAEMSALARRLEQQYPSNAGWGVLLFRLKDLVVEDVRPALLVLEAAVGLVLLIACANVVNLLLARMAGRAREVAIRGALGAARGRLLRQFLTESVLLAVAGGALGLLLAAGGTRVLVLMNAGRLPRADEVAIDLPVLLFTLALSVLAGLAVGLLPALGASRPDLQSMLKSGGRGATTGPRARIARSALVLAEVALSLVLLVAAGLLLRSFTALASVSPGFDPRGVQTLRLNLPAAKYPSEVEQGAFYRDLLSRVRALPGVESAGAGSPLPLSGENMVLAFAIQGRPVDRRERPNTSVRFITPGYLPTLRIPLVRGRQLTESDDAQAPHVVLINETMARRMWPGQDPIGQRISFNADDPSGVAWFTVVGIVGDVRHEALAVAPEMETYAPAYQAPFGLATVVVRSQRDPALLTGPVREAVREIDPSLPIFDVRTLEEVVAGSTASQRANTAMLAILAATALLLASVGLYGVISYSVAQRTQEIGLRMALGAQPAGVLRLVVGQGMLPVVIGVGVGLVAAWLGSGALAGLLYGVTTKDPLTYAGVSLLLLGVAFLACYLPGRRATRITPLEAFRYE